MRQLWAPWRYEYLASPRGPEGCIFCHAVKSPDDRDCLVLLRGPNTILILNLYPYTSGHLMIAPREHAARPSDVGPEVLSEIMQMLVRVEKALEEEFHPGGLNVGMNLGTAAGAGIPEHFHLHVLPRWEGDTNFMTSIGETRVVPMDLGDTWQRLRDRLHEAPPRP